MPPRIGVVWDAPLLFTRLVEDCGYTAELITPHLLAAPFFRRSYSALIIPGGFGNPAYSRVLPALRARESRIQRFVSGGGTVVVFGAGADSPDAYDWLGLRVVYRFGFTEGVPECSHSSPLSSLTDDCPDPVTIDGTFETGAGPAPASGAGQLMEEGGPHVVLRVRGCPVLLEYHCGAGRIILTTVHEYPSRGFLCHISPGEGETLL